MSNNYKSSRTLVFPLVSVLAIAIGTTTAFAQSPADVARPLILNESRYSLRAGEPVRINAPAETINFIRTAKTRRALIKNTSQSSFVVGPNIADDAILLAASLLTAPGDYSVNLSAVSGSGDERITVIDVTVKPLPGVSSSATQPPVVLLNGWQIGFANGGCPISTSSADTFGSLSGDLSLAGVPAVYFFDNCVEDPNGLIEDLGVKLGQFIGTQIPQVDLIAHSMGGLIVRAYLAGLQSNGTLSPPSNPRVRKFIEIATPNFGSFEATTGLGPQTSEMVPGSFFLWNLSRWNQNGDDLRGVDAIAIVGNGGTLKGNLLNSTDGVVSLLSGSFGFTRDQSRTRILPYCHIQSVGVEIWCSGNGIANVDQAPETWTIIQSFLGGTAKWQSTGQTPNQDLYLVQYGGMFFAETNTANSYLGLTQATWGGTINLTAPSSNGVFYTEFVKGTGNFTSSTPGAISCGPFTEPAGYYSTIRCKPSPQIGSVGPLLSSAAPALVVTAGATITISGIGFGSTVCSACQVRAYPGPVTLTPLSWSDTSITAVLPSSFNGITQIVAATATGQDYINIMAAPGPSLMTILTNPSGLQFSIDDGPLQMAPQTFSLVTGSTHSITLATTQPGATGTQYVFTGWSDGGTAAHSFTVNASGTLTASFETQYQLTGFASPAAGGTMTPATGGFYNAGSTVNLTATPNTGYTFAGWNGNVANVSAASTTITMDSPQAVTASFKAANTPAITSGGIVPVYSTVTTIEPGEWVSIYGANLASSAVTWTGNFPTSLGGTSVTINGKLAYLWFVSSTQINLQAPSDTTTGPVPVVVTTTNGTTASTVTLAQFAPSFSLLDSKHVAGIILRSNGSGAYGGGTYDIIGPTGTSLGYPTVAAKAGDSVVLFCVGFGPTNPAVPAGQAFSSAAPTTNPVNVLIDNLAVVPAFAGLSSAGLYQINLTVPVGLGTGDVPLVATVGEVQTPSGVVISLQ